MSQFKKDFFDLLEDADRQDVKTRDSYVRAPFGWPGSKWRSLSYILPKLPYRKGFIETCGGSGVVTINREPSELEVFNDRYAGIVAFYRCLRDLSKRQLLCSWLETTLHSREEFIWCRDSWDSCTDDVERAARWYYMVRMSFGQLGRNFGRATAGKPQHGGALQNSLELFPMIGQRFKKVQVENLDAIQCIKDYDHPDHVFYVDPDYIDSHHGIYRHRVEHKNLLDTIFASKGFFAVSGYANDLYDSYNWDSRHEWEVVVTLKAQGQSDNSLEDKTHVMRRDQKAKEILWIKESQ